MKKKMCMFSLVIMIMLIAIYPVPLNAMKSCGAAWRACMWDNIYDPVAWGFCTQGYLFCKVYA